MSPVVGKIKTEEIIDVILLDLKWVFSLKIRVNSQKLLACIRPLLAAHCI
jgi:hypothetical protein